MVIVFSVQDDLLRQDRDGLEILGHLFITFYIFFSKSEKLCFKGHLISKCLFGVFNFIQKMNEYKSTRGFIVVSRIRSLFLEETLAWKSHFYFVWPLKRYVNLNLNLIFLCCIAFQSPSDFFEAKQKNRSNSLPVVSCPWLLVKPWRRILNVCRTCQHPYR